MYSIGSEGGGGIDSNTNAFWVSGAFWVFLNVYEVI